jgi:nicotinamidase-related amidase
VAGDSSFWRFGDWAKQEMLAMESHNTALILIGFQNEYFSPQGTLYGLLHGASQVLANTVEVVERLRLKPILIVDTPIIFTPDYSELVEPTGVLKAIKELGAFKAGSAGSETVSEIRRFGERIIEVPGKRGLNAFSNTELDDLLRRRGITNVALAGCKTSLCIDSTGRSAYEKGYKVLILSDCTAATDDFEHKFYCEKIFPLYANVIDHQRFVTDLDSRDDSVRQQ